MLTIDQGLILFHPRDRLNLHEDEDGDAQPAVNLFYQQALRLLPEAVVEEEKVLGV